MCSAITRPWTGLLVCLCLAVAGCSSRPPVGEVTGQVTYKGQPVTDGVIVFNNEAKGVFMTAKLDKEGNYVFHTARGAGLPIGSYQVSITPPRPDLPFGAPPQPPPENPDYPNIPEKYRKPETSGFTAEVQQGANESFNFNMED